MPSKLIYTSEVKFPNHFIPSFWNTKFEPWKAKKVPGKGYRLINKMQYSVKDPLTNEVYLNDSRNVLRLKCCILAFVVPVFYTSVIIASITWDIVKLFINLSMFVTGNISKDKIYNVPHDILKILLTPLLLIAAEATLLIGLVFPLNARKIFASIERLFVNNNDVANKINARLSKEKIEAFEEKYKTTFEDALEEYQTYEDKKIFPDILELRYIEKGSNYKSMLYDKLMQELRANGENDELWIKAQNKYKSFQALSKIIYFKKSKHLLAECFHPKQDTEFSELYKQGMGLSSN